MREREQEATAGESAADLDELLVLAADLVDAEHRAEAERRRRHYRGDRLLYLLNEDRAGQAARSSAPQVPHRRVDLRASLRDAMAEALEGAGDLDAATAADPVSEPLVSHPGTPVGWGRPRATRRVRRLATAAVFVLATAGVTLTAYRTWGSEPRVKGVPYTYGTPTSGPVAGPTLPAPAATPPPSATERVEAPAPVPVPAPAAAPVSRSAVAAHPPPRPAPAPAPRQVPANPCTSNGCPYDQWAHDGFPWTYHGFPFNR
jgi:hypothetical protein